MYETPEQYKAHFNDLIKDWSPRTDKLKDWYHLLALVDELKDDELESFVGNDPRTFYNMSLSLLNPKVIPYNIPATVYSPTEQDSIASVENLINRIWAKMDYKITRAGKGSTWLEHFMSTMLATGWYSVFAIAIGEDFYADIWSAAETFPVYDEEGLSECLHAYKLSASGARKRAKNNNWEFKTTSDADVEVYDYWYFDEDANVVNCVIFNNTQVKHETYDWLYEIPILVSGVGGLPDRGSITSDEVAKDVNWRATSGQSILATNEKIYDSFNRQNSFMHQIVRDTAQPRIIERTRSKGVVNSKNWNLRGAIYHLDVDEDIHTMQMPGPPPELSLSLQGMQGMMQRGSFDFSLFHGGQESGYSQALTSAGAQHVLRPFKEARDFVLTAICNMWLYCVSIGKAKFSQPIPDGFPEDAKFHCEIEISVPGDLIQRATTARQLDPDFRLSQVTTTNLMFPEIVDPNLEVVNARVDKAMQSPVFASLDTIEALHEHADALDAQGRTRHAERYRAYAQRLEQEINQSPSVALPMGYQNRTMNQGPPGQANAGQ